MLQVAKAMRALTDEGGREIAAMFIDVPSRAMFPDYYDVVKKPIAIKTIEGRIKNRKYRMTPLVKCFHGMDDDIELLVANARAYNPPDSQVCADAAALRSCYTEQKRLAMVTLTADASLWTGTPASITKSEKHNVRMLPDVKARCKRIMEVLGESGRLSERMEAKLGSMSAAEREAWEQGHATSLQSVTTQLQVGGYPSLALYGADIHVALNHMAALGRLKTSGERVRADSTPGPAIVFH